MRMLVTGGAGFVGLNVVEALLLRGSAVAVADLATLPSDANAEFHQLPGELCERRLDVRSASEVEDLIISFRPDVIIHAAAITPNLSREMRSATTVVEINIGGLTRVLDAIAGAPSIHLVYVGSSAVFGAAAGADWNDEQSHSPQSLYGITKSASEAIVRRWAYVNKRRASIARLGWVYGPFERDTGTRDTLSAVYQVLSIAQKGGAAVFSRDAQLDWLYARDAGAAIAEIAMATPETTTAFNIGPGRRWKLSTWCNLLAVRYPAFRWRVGKPANVQLHAEVDDPPLLSTNFANKYNTFRFRDPGAALQDYLLWLSNHRGLSRS